MAISDDARTPGDSQDAGDALETTETDDAREALDDADEKLVDGELTGEGLLPLPDGGASDDPAPAP